MAEIDPQDARIRELINEVCEKVVRTCNTVTNHADKYGYGLMTVPDPDVTKLYGLLHLMVIPILENLMVDTDIRPEDGIKLENIREYLRLLRNIVESIKDDDEAAFDAAMGQLRNQAYLVID